jgi:hypothetical protein
MSEPKSEELPWWRTHPWQGRHLFWENRNKVPLEVLEKYNNMHVAWFPDGSGIRDADADGEAMIKRIEESGDDPQWYTYEYVETGPII